MLTNMKNKLLRLFGRGSVRRNGDRVLNRAESADWVTGQIAKMSELRQDLFSVKAVKQ